MQLPSLSILIPCYNTQTTVESVIQNAYTVGKQVSRTVEIIVIDDASSDNTATILASLQEKIPILRIYTHADNKGYGATIKSLYMKARYDWLFSLPSDDQFDAKELKKLVVHTKSADMILGLRAQRNDNMKRKVQSFIYNRLLNLLYGLAINDVNTIRLMKRHTFKQITLISDSAFVDAELAIRMKKRGAHIVEVPITHKMREDHGGSGGKFFRTILPTVVEMVTMKFREYDLASSSS